MFWKRGPRQLRNRTTRRVRPAPDEVLWLMRPDAIDRARATAPDPEIRRHAVEMIERGYTVVEQAVPGDLCDGVVADFRRWCAENSEHVQPFLDPYGHYPRLHNLQHASRNAELVFACNRALPIEDFCFGYRTTLCSSLFYERGSGQTIHRDLPYFCTVPLHFYFGMWVALEDVDPGNGPLLVWPGGHRSQIDPYQIASQVVPPGSAIPPVHDPLWRAYQGELERQCAEAGIVPEPILARKGDTVVWHPLLPHAGGPIHDLTRTRFSIVFHTTPGHVPMYQADVFFDRSAKPSPDSKWTYREVEGRLVADHGQTEFPLGAQNYY
jgi:phytanoyl-CoA hydroxylase